MDSGRLQPPMLAGQVPDPAIQSDGPEDSGRQKTILLYPFVMTRTNKTRVSHQKQSSFVFVKPLF